jgi:hypothetical protein
MAFSYLGRNVHQTRTSYEKAMVAYALSFSSDADAKNAAYTIMKATAREETVQGTFTALTFTQFCVFTEE